MIALPTRIEEKFCVPAQQADAALGLARLFLDPDRESPGEQTVTSLYLDTPALTFLGWQRARQRDRFKLRLRRYGTGTQTPVFAEIKHKSEDRVSKLRASIAGADVGALLSGRDVMPLDAPQRGGLLAFVHRQRAFGASPQVLVRCRRRALRGDGVERALGVTVDCAIEYQRWTVGAFDEHPAGWRPLAIPGAGTEAVVELKHAGRPPGWMARLLDELAPWRQSFSKYGTSISRALRDERGVS